MTAGAVLGLQVLLAVRPVAAQHIPGDVQAGRRIADTWCRNCHVVGREGTGPSADAAPTFAAIAQQPSTTALSLRAFLQTPHHRMPDYNLTREQMDDVIAYLLSLRNR